MSFNLENPIMKVFYDNSRNRKPVPAKPKVAPKKTMVEMMDNFVQAEKKPNFLSLRQRQNAIAQQRIHKCEKTIQRCQ